MFLGALLDGLSLEALRDALASFPVDGYQLDAQRITRQGLSGTQFRVILDRREQPHRHLSDVAAIIRGSALEPEIQESAVRVFRRLAEAEAAIHGTSVDEVHFHEVGAVDAIVNITGAVWGLRALGVERVYASSIPGKRIGHDVPRRAARTRRPPSPFSPALRPRFAQARRRPSW